jgi:hypothetical protein
VQVYGAGDRETFERHGDHRIAKRDPRRLTKNARPADDGFVSLDEHSAADFISRCAKLRFWPRQAAIAQRVGAATASAGQA